VRNCDTVVVQRFDGGHSISVGIDHATIDATRVADRLLNGTLAAEQREAFLIHMTDCEECRDRVALAAAFRKEQSKEQGCAAMINLRSLEELIAAKSAGAPSSMAASDAPSEIILEVRQPAGISSVWLAAISFFVLLAIAIGFFVLANEI